MASDLRVRVNSFFFSMRPSNSIVAGATAILVTICGPSGFGATGTLRYDGAYRRVGADKTTQHLRFYRDGFVVSAATPKTLPPVWLQRDFPGLPTGRYSVRGNRIQITLNTNLPDVLSASERGSIPRTLHYAGVIGPGYLELVRDGRTESKRYDFVKIESSSIAAAQLKGEGGTAVDAKGVRHTWVADSGKPAPWRADLTKMVSPAYPYEARRARQEGSGVFRLQLDLTTGKATKATVLKSTGIVMLDNSALWALRRWQFKPGRWREIELPISFLVSAVQSVPPSKAR